MIFEYNLNKTRINADERKDIAKSVFTFSLFKNDDKTTK